MAKTLPPIPKKTIIYEQIVVNKYRIKNGHFLIFFLQGPLFLVERRLLFLLFKYSDYLLTLHNRGYMQFNLGILVNKLLSLADDTLSEGSIDKNKASEKRRKSVRFFWHQKKDVYRHFFLVDDFIILHVSSFSV